MGTRKVDIPVDHAVRELLRRGKGDLTWDQYLLSLQKHADELVKNAKRFGK